MDLVNILPMIFVGVTFVTLVGYLLIDSFSRGRSDFDEYYERFSLKEPRTLGTFDPRW